MTNEYDIFQCLSDGSVRWRERASGLIRARRRLRELVVSSSGEYFAVEQLTRAVIFPAGSPAVGKRVFQIAYNQALSTRLANLLRSIGYGVLSTIGNVAARKLLLKIPSHPHVIDVFIVGQGAPKYTRQEMVRWLKSRHQVATIIALNPPDQELIEADYNVLQNGPESWLRLLPNTADPTKRVR
jgi:hypothetical protein